MEAGAHSCGGPTGHGVLLVRGLRWPRVLPLGRSGAARALARRTPTAPV